MITFLPVVIGIFVTDGLTIQHHLRGMVGVGFQEQRIHVRMTGDACCFGLYGLGATNLQPLRSGIGIECHILSLERCRTIAVLLKDTTQGGGDDALANIAACSYEHDGVKTLPRPLPMSEGSR